MKNVIKLLAVLALALGTLGVSVPSALAAPPLNDTFAGAKAAAIGFSEVVDTREATTDSEDTQLNQSCGAPATDASVWYTLAGSDQWVVIDVSQSNYTAGVLVGVGSQGNLQTVACGPGAVAFYTDPETTYYVLAIDDQFDGGGNGGELHISFNDVPPPPKVEITLDPVGKVNARTGVARVSGTFTCTDGDFIELFGEARQNVGRFTVIGSFGAFDSGTCDGTPHNWSADVIPFNGKFAGGKTMTVTFAFSCGLFQCGDGFVERQVMLRGGLK